MDAERPLGVLLREERRRRGVSQSALARRTGIPQPAISRIENGREEPSIERLARLLSGLGLRPAVAVTPLAEPTGDRRHMGAVAALTPGERIEQAAGWIALANEIHGRADDAEAPAVA